MTLALCLLSLTALSSGCAPKTVVVPDSHALIDLSGGTGPMPGYVGVSEGYLLEIFRELEDCHSEGK